MKKAIILVFVFISVYTIAQLPIANEFASNKKEFHPEITNGANAELRKINHKAFKPGEILEYVVHYGLIDAGIARVELIDEGKTIGGRKIYHVIGTGVTRGAFDWFYKVRDRYETYIDAEGVFPYIFIRRVDEGGYIINQDYKFLQAKNKVDVGNGKSFESPDYVQDMISAIYFARTIDLSNIKPGDVITIDAFVDNEVWPAKIRYVGTKTISIRKGKYDCMVFNPVIQKGRIFKNESDMSVYITNDENKIPILAEAKVIVGSIKMELTKYEGLANPVAKVK
ncbi:MAG: DUF3108 domain-containing protein [Bacteroidota bacterium]|nr:DUF3108 domain-containing protein [Bacteroidota bacterium]